MRYSDNVEKAVEKKGAALEIDSSYFKDGKTFNYNEALDLAGSGSYNIGLMVTLSMALWAMCLDLFSFSMVVSFADCEWKLKLGQKSFLVSIPFIGPVLMAYAWGYISDTQGRKKSLIIALTISYVAATLSAFTPNWIVLAILKLIGTCCSSCAQSGTCTLLGESCPERVKGTYMIIMSSVVHLGSTTYFVLSYFIGDMDFFYDLGFITFVPWRFLVLVLALPLGLSAVCLYFFYESPKYLLNAGREDEALNVLRNIYRRNGGNVNDYPVQNVVLIEEGNLTRKDISLMESMWEQTAPLFKPPLLLQTLLLYYIIFVIYSANSGLYVWLPFLARAFTANISSDVPEGLCNTILYMSKNTSSSLDLCSSSLELPLVLASVTYGCSVGILNVFMSKLASRKRALMTIIPLFACLCSLGTAAIPSNKSNFLYFGILITSMCMGPVASYYVDLYPTSFRGMASCLGVMVARISGVIGINVIGPFIINNCAATFYGCAVLLFSGVLMAYFLPPDRPKKTK